MHIKMKITYKPAMSGSAQSHLCDGRGHDFSPAAGPAARILLLCPSAWTHICRPLNRRPRDHRGAAVPWLYHGVLCAVWPGWGGGGIKHLLGGLTSACTYPYLKRLYCEQITPLTPWGPRRCFHLSVTVDHTFQIG